jgi:hypothetical protein
MPASAAAAMTVFALWRTTHSVVVTEETSMAGWLIWTAMKRAPATAAEMPAAWVRPFVVTVMVGSLVLVREPGGMSGHVTDARNRRGDPASPCDVTWWVIRPLSHTGRTRSPESSARTTRNEKIRNPRPLMRWSR